MSVEEIINAEYPLEPYRVDALLIIRNAKQEKLRQAAQFGYGLGLKEGLAFVDWINHNEYAPHADGVHWLDCTHNVVTSEQLFEQFKSERDGDK